MTRTLHLNLIACLLLPLSITPIAAGSRAPTKPLSERVQQAETVFLGKVVNKVVDGDWAQAELLVEQPLRNAKKGMKIDVTWRITVGSFFIYDVADGTQGIAILKDKHKNRYWLRADKFEKPEKLAEVKALIKATYAETPKETTKVARTEITLTPAKPYILPDLTTRIEIRQEGSFNGVLGWPTLVRHHLILNIAPNTVIASGGYVFHLTTPFDYKTHARFDGDVGMTDVDSCKFAFGSEKKPAPILKLGKLQGDLAFKVYPPIYYESNNGQKTSPLQKISAAGKHFVAVRVTGADFFRKPVKDPDGVFRAGHSPKFVNVKLNVVSNFGATDVLLKSGTKESFVLGPEKIAIELLSYDGKDSVKLRINATPQAPQAPALILEYGEATEKK